MSLSPPGGDPAAGGSPRVRTPPIGCALALVFLVGCGGGGADPTEPSGLDGEAAARLLGPSWARSAVASPAVVTRLLDAPGGGGWLQLFHGDLDAAERSFEPYAAAPEARLGLARVHLARADALRVAEALHRRVALDLARYRRDRRERLRTGPHEHRLAALSAVAGGADGEEREAFVASAKAEGEGPLFALLTARLEGGPLPEGLPDPLARRLLFARAVDRADVGTAGTLRAGLGWGSPAFEDPLGGDEEAGLRFTAPYFDAEPLRAERRLYALRAAELSSGLGPAEAPIRAAAAALWEGELPEGPRADAAADLPAWTALLFAPTPDEASWGTYWADPSGEGPTVQAFLAAAGIDPRARDAAGTDALLRAAAAAEPVLDRALPEGADGEGASLARELRLGRAWLDGLLRARMRGLLAADAAIQAKRAGERSLDPSPGSLGGPEDARRTRVSYRNDRAFLLSLASVLYAAGQPGAALDYVHPLAVEDARLRGLEHYLGQLDAAGSIGVLGKANRM